MCPAPENANWDLIWDLKKLESKIPFILPTVKHFKTVIWFWWSIRTDRLLLYGLYFESMHYLSSPSHLMVKCFKIQHVEAKLAEPLRSTSPLACTVNLKFLLNAFVTAVSLLVLWVAVTTAAFLFFYCCWQLCPHSAVQTAFWTYGVAISGKLLHC